MNAPIRPKNWLVESILVTLLCCLPFGIVGIVNAANVNTRYDAGDFVGAERASAEAGRWTKIGFWVRLASVVLLLLFYFFLFALLFGAAAVGASSH
ncbi:MAG: CD225/dispanin family protein [Flavobacteriales bacterium]|nr:CD225/dispanin family protein [Flavobacteriales bacterium]